MDINEILKHLPHRYPMLLVDRVLEIEPGKRIKALKNVTMNEPFFTGHFPHLPVMPGVLIVEAMAQAAGILSFKTMGILPSDDSVYLFAGIDKARFRKAVVPGDQLVMEIETIRQSKALGKYLGKAYVDGQLAAEAEMLCTLRSTDAAGKGAA
ncbi:3-hydroxyacyl-ACP dehydratase FabZ [Derxia gummosa]|uniref:3-hydroxyacyl-[acyl-carrier-protein] dehydratase FabZ n=1 Tax=Derxia gummosa DSM 723 TaxID=1121388 RepID=A0A8B6X3I7_9BURK|nr:3-hydroxyacyl-ACP dehydratase FabZ [Derxia gummosa]